MNPSRLVRAFPAGSFVPDPGSAPMGRMLAAQTAMELKLTLRNGEQLLLNLIIPVLLTVVLVAEPFIDVGHRSRSGFFVPGILALAVMSASFTGLAIATGFDRKYGVLKRLGATPLPRSVLLLGKAGSVTVLELLQILLICLIGVAVGWRPHGSPAVTVPSAALLVVLGTAAFAGLAMLIAGVLRAEATLALANIVWFGLLVVGDVVFPLARFPHGFEVVLAVTPTAALAHGLRVVLTGGSGPPLHDVVALAAWAVVALTAAARFFRWE